MTPPPPPCLARCSTIASAARLLSQELYTKDDHVVLELVQNADDCAYDKGIDPAFQLILLERGLLVASNEQGFAPANVKAICNLGSSSKSRSLGAFTGEKGGHCRGSPPLVVLCTVCHSTKAVCLTSSGLLCRYHL